VQGDYDASELALQRGLDAAIATKNRWWHPRCLAELGCVAGYRKDYELAEQLLSEALDRWKELNHEPFFAWGLAQLGHIKATQNNSRLTEAHQLYKQGLALALKHKQAPIAFDIFVGFAKLLLDVGEQGMAVKLLNIAAHHPASYYETKQKARKLLDVVNIDLSQPHPEMDWQIVTTELIDRLAKTSGE